MLWMRKIKFLMALSLVLLVLTGCQAVTNTVEPVATEAVATEEVAKAEYKKISAEEAKALMDEGDYLVVDVRSAQEFATGHIEGAVNHDVQDLANIAKTVPDLESKVLVYCRSGNRSRFAAQTMIEMGYSNVIDFGGINDWPYGTVR